MVGESHMSSVKNAAIFEEMKAGPTRAELAARSSYDLGVLVECAYEMYEKDPGNLRPALPANFPAGRYDVISYILFSDFFDGGWTQRFYGLFVEDKTAPNTYVIAIRGTQGWEEWWDDFHILPTRYPAGGMVERGFYEIYKTMAVTPLGAGALQDGAAFIKRLEQISAGAARPAFRFVGHSLGSALANFAALDAALRIGGSSDIALTTFACPLTGDQGFVDVLEANVSDNARIVNIPDLVPDLPPGMGYVQVNTAYFIDSRNFSAISRTYACYHSLLTYLYCLNPLNPLGLAAACKAAG